MTYCASFWISRLCPLLYIIACELAMNHFPASLLQEMKVFIMVTVGRCEAFTVIYLGKMTDSLTMGEQWFTIGAMQCPLLHCAVPVQGACLQHGGRRASPLAAYSCSKVTSSAHYLASAELPGGGKRHFVEKNRLFLISSPIRLPTWRLPYNLTSPSDLQFLQNILPRDTAKNSRSL